MEAISTQRPLDLLGGAKAYHGPVPLLWLYGWPPPSPGILDLELVWAKAHEITHGHVLPQQLHCPAVVPPAHDDALPAGQPA